ncbi:hypothetical protein ABZ816_35120 [Actinosynnema sp. NPDC047251]|uniref:hypothetical protein n=1 Tax=Saccharothrix espanaensis TaxID=103731 RepID=UPI000310A26C|nr:hypothetical protein [Saccharothrix espanaensis]
MQVEFSAGTAPDRLAALLLWVVCLDGVTLTWNLRTDRVLTVAATARNRAGLEFGLTASVGLAELGVVVAGQSAVKVGPFRLVPSVVEPVTFEEVSRLVHLGRAVARRQGVGHVEAA